MADLRQLAELAKSTARYDSAPNSELADIARILDLLARVRAGCVIDVSDTEFGCPRILVNDGPVDLLRELAEALTHETGRSVPVLGERP